MNIQEDTITAEELAEEAVAEAEAPAPTKRSRKPKGEAAPKEPKAPKEPAGPRDITVGETTIKLDSTITLLVESNPKRGESAKRFANYETGQTVAEALAVGLKRADIVWDITRGYISVS